MRIAYAAEATPNGFYRGVFPMTALAQLHGHRVRRLAVEPERWSAADAQDLDVLFVHRYCDEPAQRLVREAQTRGAAIIWDNDDDILSVPKSVASHKRAGGVAGERRLADMRRILALADLVTTPSPHLASRFLELGAPRVTIIENYLPDSYLQPAARPHGGLVIGWVAGLEHQMDVETLSVRAVLQRLLDERPDVRVVSIGLRLGLRGERYEHRGKVPFVELTRVLANFDIGIAPIAALDFNRARSNVKLKEYAAAGVPWLASPIGPYVGMGEKQGGRLVADDHWHPELTFLLDKPRERRKLVKRGRKWVACQTLAMNGGTWETAFANALERTRT